ncbi:hypothetical protein [Vreelandella sp. EE22]
MGFQLFYFESTDLTSEARWFLWQWERRIGLHKPFDGTVKDLLSHLKMSVKQGQKTLLEMKKNGVIETASVIKKVGRPSYRYCIAKTMLETLKNLRSEAPLLSDFIEHISEYDPPVAGDTGNERDQDKANSVSLSVYNETALIDSTLLFNKTSDENEKIIKLPLPIRQPNLYHSHQRKERLTQSNRWLLLVMLARSEVPGIVTNLSNAKLQRLTGMTANQLASQIKKLKTLGIILDHQTGQAGKVLGERMISIYQLDLSHSLLGRPNSKVLTLYSPILNNNTFTELSHGLIDAMIVYIISSEYRAILTKRLDYLYTQIHIEKDSTKVTSNISSRLESLKKIEKEINESISAFYDAKNFLPTIDHLYSTIKAFAINCDTSQVDWLRTRIHTQAMQILSMQWKYLENNEPLPNSPDFQEKPEAALRHQLAYKLAMDLHHLLKKAAAKQQNIDFKFELLNFTLTPYYELNKETLSALVLRCFTINDNTIGLLPDCIIEKSYIYFNMRKYWQTHRQKIISAQPS